jgi:hypothetical protein
MSERGSFVTEYIYCQDCFAAAARILVLGGGNSAVIGGHIIAGQAGSTYAGGEIIDFDMGHVPDLEAVICHTLRIAVIADNGDAKIFHIHPGGVESASCALDNPSESM